MSDRKTITINPELFSISANNTTRKKREPKEPKELKIKTGPSKQTAKTLKNKLLNYIRKTQEENFRKMHGHEPEIVSHTTSIKPDDSFNNDFENSLKYLNEIVDNAANSAANHSLANATLKNYKAMNPESILNKSNSLDIPFYNTLPNPLPDSNPLKLQPPRSGPSWGCLKGGALPTYRNWKNHTQRVSAQPYGGSAQPYGRSAQPYGGSAQPMITVTNPATNLPIPVQNNTSVQAPVYGGNQTQLIDDTQRAIINKTREKMDQATIQVKKTQLKYKKRKKTIRRTYKVGKSKTAPKIGVLISNKTIRSNISTKKQQLKQIPIEEIRKTLIKRGFIKVGSIAPNDVLRQMYESMVLVCGEVQNYNPDNLIYNFFNESS